MRVPVGCQADDGSASKVGSCMSCLDFFWLSQGDTYPDLILEAISISVYVELARNVWLRGFSRPGSGSRRMHAELHWFPGSYPHVVTGRQLLRDLYWYYFGHLAPPISHRGISSCTMHSHHMTFGVDGIILLQSRKPIKQRLSHTQLVYLSLLYPEAAA